MMDGLGAIGQAAISLGGYEVIAFEKDREMWLEAQKIFWIILLSRKIRKKCWHLASQNLLRFDGVFLYLVDSSCFVEVEK